MEKLSIIAKALPGSIDYRHEIDLRRIRQERDRPYSSPYPRPVTGDEGVLMIGGKKKKLTSVENLIGQEALLVDILTRPNSTSPKHVNQPHGKKESVHHPRLGSKSKIQRQKLDKQGPLLQSKNESALGIGETEFDLQENEEIDDLENWKVLTDVSPDHIIDTSNLPIKDGQNLSMNNMPSESVAIDQSHYLKPSNNLRENESVDRFFFDQWLAQNNSSLQFADPLNVELLCGLQNSISKAKLQQSLYYHRQNSPSRFTKQINSKGHDQNTVQKSKEISIRYHKLVGAVALEAMDMLIEQMGVQLPVLQDIRDALYPLLFRHIHEPHHPVETATAALSPSRRQHFNFSPPLSPNSKFLAIRKTMASSFHLDHDDTLHETDHDVHHRDIEEASHHTDDSPQIIYSRRNASSHDSHQASVTSSNQWRPSPLLISTHLPNTDGADLSAHEMEILLGESNSRSNSPKKIIEATISGKKYFEKKTWYEDIVQFHEIVHKIENQLNEEKKNKKKFKKKSHELENEVINKINELKLLQSKLDLLIRDSKNERHDHDQTKEKLKMMEEKYLHEKDAKIFLENKLLNWDDELNNIKNEAYESHKRIEILEGLSNNITTELEESQKQCEHYKKQLDEKKIEFLQEIILLQDKIGILKSDEQTFHSWFRQKIPQIRGIIQSIQPYIEDRETEKKELMKLIVLTPNISFDMKYFNYVDKWIKFMQDEIQGYKQSNQRIQAMNENLAGMLAKMEVAAKQEVMTIQQENQMKLKYHQDLWEETTKRHEVELQSKERAMTAVTFRMHNMERTMAQLKDDINNKQLNYYDTLSIYKSKIRQLEENCEMLQSDAYYAAQCLHSQSYINEGKVYINELNHEMFQMNAKLQENEGIIRTLSETIAKNHETSHQNAILARNAFDSKLKEYRDEKDKEIIELQTLLTSMKQREEIKNQALRDAKSKVYKLERDNTNLNKSQKAMAGFVKDNESKLMQREDSRVIEQRQSKGRRRKDLKNKNFDSNDDEDGEEEEEGDVIEEDEMSTKSALSKFMKDVDSNLNQKKKSKRWNPSSSQIWNSDDDYDNDQEAEEYLKRIVAKKRNHLHAQGILTSSLSMRDSKLSSFDDLTLNHSTHNPHHSNLNSIPNLAKITLFDENSYEPASTNVTAQDAAFLYLVERFDEERAKLSQIQKDYQAEKIMMQREMDAFSKAFELAQNHWVEYLKKLDHRNHPMQSMQSNPSLRMINEPSDVTLSTLKIITHPVPPRKPKHKDSDTDMVFTEEKSTDDIKKIDQPKVPLDKPTEPKKPSNLKSVRKIDGKPRVKKSIRFADSVDSHDFGPSNESEESSVHEGLLQSPSNKAFNAYVGERFTVSTQTTESTFKDKYDLHSELTSKLAKHVSPNELSQPFLRYIRKHEKIYAREIGLMKIVLRESKRLYNELRSELTIIINALPKANGSFSALPDVVIPHSQPNPLAAPNATEIIHQHRLNSIAVSSFLSDKIIQLKDIIEDNSWIFDPNFFVRTISSNVPAALLNREDDANATYDPIDVATQMRIIESYTQAVKEHKAEATDPVKTTMKDLLFDLASRVESQGGWKSILYSSDGTADLDLDITPWSDEDKILILQEKLKFARRQRSREEQKYIDIIQRLYQLVVRYSNQNNQEEVDAVSNIVHDVQMNIRSGLTMDDSTSLPPKDNSQLDLIDSLMKSDIENQQLLQVMSQYLIDMEYALEQSLVAVRKIYDQKLHLDKSDPFFQPHLSKSVASDSFDFLSIENELPQLTSKHDSTTKLDLKPLNKRKGKPLQARVLKGFGEFGSYDHQFDISKKPLMVSNSTSSLNPTTYNLNRQNKSNAAVKGGGSRPPSRPTTGTNLKGNSSDEGLSDHKDRVFIPLVAPLTSTSSQSIAHQPMDSGVCHPLSSGRVSKGKFPLNTGGKSFVDNATHEGWRNFEIHRRRERGLNEAKRSKSPEALANSPRIHSPIPPALERIDDLKQTSQQLVGQEDPLEESIGKTVVETNHDVKDYADFRMQKLKDFKEHSDDVTKDLLGLCEKLQMNLVHGSMILESQDWSSSVSDVLVPGGSISDEKVPDQKEVPHDKRKSSRMLMIDDSKSTSYLPSHSLDPMPSTQPNDPFISFVDPEIGDDIDSNELDDFSSPDRKSRIQFLNPSMRMTPIQIKRQRPQTATVIHPPKKSTIKPVVPTPNLDNQSVLEASSLTKVDLLPVNHASMAFDDINTYISTVNEKYKEHLLEARKLEQLMHALDIRRGAHHAINEAVSEFSRSFRNHYQGMAELKYKNPLVLS